MGGTSEVKSRIWGSGVGRGEVGGRGVDPEGNGETDPTLQWQDDIGGSTGGAGMVENSDEKRVRQAQILDWDPIDGGNKISEASIQSQ